MAQVKRVLVTGGAGFLGSHLVEDLLARGDHVTILDDLSTGRRANIPEGVELLLGDVRHVDIQRGALDQIFHLACPASPPAYQRDMVRTLRTAVEGTRAVMELAVARGASVLIASTSEVYGDPDVHPQPETYWGNANSWGPRACYDEGKRAAEAVAYAFQHQRAARVAVARIFNSYGPRMDVDDGRVVSNLVGQALRGESLTIYGNGSQTRSLCYCKDTVAGLIALMERGVNAGPVNVGCDEERTVLELALTVKRLTGSQSPLEVRSLPVDDPRRRRPDIAKMRELTGWSASTPLDLGLVETIEDFRKRLR
jgi:UDP-glucuronate decarboxylase